MYKKQTKHRRFLTHAMLMATMLTFPAHRVQAADATATDTPATAKPASAKLEPAKPSAASTVTSAHPAKKTIPTILTKPSLTSDNIEVPTQMKKPSKEANDIFQHGHDIYHGEPTFMNRHFRVAAELFGEAANLGHPEAIYYLASMYDSGQGVTEDQEYAKELYMQAAQMGHPDSQMIVGMLYVFEAYNHKPGSAEEAKALELAAKWMKVPAQKGLSEAEFFYGDMLVKGAGIPKNEKLGIDYLTRSAKQNNPNGQAMLGVDYWQGNGVEKNNVTALKWLLLSHYGKNDNAPKLIALVAKEMTQEDKQKATKEAQAWIEAYQKAHPPAAEKPARQKPRFNFYNR